MLNTYVGVYNVIIITINNVNDDYHECANYVYCI